MFFLLFSSRSFKNPSAAQIGVMGVVFITGFIAVNAYYIMDSIEKTKRIASALRPLFRMWPAYNLGDGLIALASAFWTRRILDDDTRPFDWDVAGKPIALLYSLSVPYFLLLLLLEFSHDGGSGSFVGRYLRSIRGSCDRSLLRWYGVRKKGDVLALDDGLHEPQEIVDTDVEEERLLVTEQIETLRNSAPVLFADLWKIYPPSTGLFGVILASIRRFLAAVFCCFCRRRSSETTEDQEDKRRGLLPKRAVRGITIAVRQGEVLSLLGPNG